MNLPDLLKEIFERTQIRGSELGKIVIRADKTFIQAAPLDADRILRAFKNDPDLRFKLDDGRDDRKENKDGKRPSRREKRQREERNPVHAGKPDNVSQFKGDKKKKKYDKAADKPKRKPLREEFWSLIDSGD